MLTSTPVSKSPQTEGTLSQWKQLLLKRRSELRDEYQHDPFPPRLTNAHRRLVDGILQNICRVLDLPRTLALLAVGGYGRKQLFPYSDIDLLVLLRNNADLVLREQLERFVSLLWDIGLDVGHSVRTIAECQEQARKDVTVQTNLMEARLLYGSASLYKKFSEAMRTIMDSAAFFQAKQLEQDQRHARFYDTANNLEPNLKESPGGLRDLQNILWISQACGWARPGKPWRNMA